LSKSFRHVDRPERCIPHAGNASHRKWSTTHEHDHHQGRRVYLLSSGDAGAAWKNAKESVISLGGRVEKDTGEYLWATFRSRIWRFVDDVELRMEAGGKAIHVRSASRVGWDGRLHDCDFNQMLDLGVGPEAPEHIDVFDRAALEARRIVVGRHCFGCTAGAGSSCGGATA
jgi:hypothetical protein